MIFQLISCSHSFYWELICNSWVMQAIFYFKFHLNHEFQLNWSKFQLNFRCKFIIKLKLIFSFGNYLFHEMNWLIIPMIKKKLKPLKHQSICQVEKCGRVKSENRILSSDFWPNNIAHNKKKMHELHNKSINYFLSGCFKRFYQ